MYIRGVSRAICEIKIVSRTSGLANTSIAIDRSIAECQLIDRSWFCIELTRHLKAHFSINIPFYCILWHFVLVTLLPTSRSRVIKKFSSRSQSKTSWPPLPYINAWNPAKHNRKHNTKTADLKETVWNVSKIVIFVSVNDKKDVKLLKMLVSWVCCHCCTSCMFYDSDSGISCTEVCWRQK